MATSIAVPRTSRRRRIGLALLATAMLTAAGCGSEVTSSNESLPDNSITPPEAVPVGTEPPANSSPADKSADSLPNSRVAAAIADAAERRGVAADGITVVSAEEVTWPDGAVGCPQQDRLYTMALVPGGRIVLDVDGQIDSYHYSTDGEPFYCATPTQPAQVERNISTDH